MKKLSSDWFRDKTPKQKEEIEFVLRNNTTLIQSILDILTRLENEESRSEISSSQYDNPSWAYKQADTNGARRALAKVRALFTFD